MLQPDYRAAVTKEIDLMRKTDTVNKALFDIRKLTIIVLSVDEKQFLELLMIYIVNQSNNYNNKKSS